jgi:DNA-binding response OmpR family regulator
MSTRILVVDGSSLTAWLVAHVAPPDVEVLHAATLAQAESVLADTPPDAAIFNLTPARLEWKALFERCRGHVPPIPYLCSSAFDEGESCDLGACCTDAECFSKSLPIPQLREKVATLVERARAGGRPDTCATDARRT